ncbi:MAG: CoA ester lyase [Pseudomonadaceae bacterium]|nr:CoA ester lyase [Pseudomonadaceae bacterium]
MTAHPRSLLFVPGSRPERFVKAIAAGADLVCIDLEDAVGPGQKDEARTAVVSFLAESPDNVGVRINALNSELGVFDAAALLAADFSPAFVMLPKVEDAGPISWASDLFAESVRIIPIIESARGLANAHGICEQDRVSEVLFGAVDYSAELGCTLSWDALFYARITLINAAVCGDATLLDAPWIDVADASGLAEEVRRTRALGMPARAAIHPSQIPVIHAALAPSVAELEYARRVVDAFETADGGAALLDGKLIERPVVESARRTLARADRSNPGQ